ncbi:MAG: glutamate synthase subunit beta, partial [Chromatiaceae bacterium]|nr:glutamate synthase subunit beta [Chromatiaceae bacterium]
AQQLARVGHKVHVYEKADRIGGLLRYGIPDFKMEKFLIDRRIAQMHAEGVAFHTQTHVGVDMPVSRLLDDFDALVLAGGSEHPRDLPIPGRELEGVHFALDFLQPQNHRVAGDRINGFTAEARQVVVIGGGDTGSDCIGTSNRQGAQSVTQIEILPKPPERENKALTWPEWPNRLRTSSSHEEGCERMWSIATKSFLDDGQGRVRAVSCVRVEWTRDEAGGWRMTEVPGSEFELQADLVLLAMGFVHPVREGLLAGLRVELDGRGNVKSGTEGPEAYHTSAPRVFTAGDMRRGQSLVVWAIREGRQCARAVDEYLMGKSELPR